MPIPRNGSTVTFQRVPAGSYATPGVPYKVAHNTVTRRGRKVLCEVWLERTEGPQVMGRGSSTADHPAMYERAIWSVVA